MAVSDSPNEATRRLLLALLIGDFDFRNSKKKSLRPGFEVSELVALDVEGWVVMVG